MKKILKKILPGFIIDLYMWCRLNKSEKHINRELKRLKKTERFQVGYTDILGSESKLMFVDSLSFLFIYDEIFVNQIYQFLSSKTNPYIIDAGANIGLGLIYFKSIYPNSEIIAFEPDEKAFKALEYNVSSLQLKNITLIKKALWDTVTELNFYSEGADSGRLTNDQVATQVIKTQTTVLSEYLKDRKVDMLKIDIEGAELNVLKECKNYLKNVSNIFVEYHSFKNSPQNLAMLIRILEEDGFRIIIHHIGMYSSQPFVKIEEYNGMDLQLNIYGIRV
jgi:FkbM family methyltransferase